MKKALYGIFLLLYMMFSLSLVACGGGTENEIVPEKPERYTVTVVNGEGSGEYEKDASVTVVATVPSGKVFKEWQISGEKVSEDTTYTFTVEKDVTVTAVFDDEIVIYYTVTRINIVSKAESAVGEQEYAAGTQVEFTAEEIEYKVFVEWRVDGEKVSEDTTYTFTVEKDVTVTAIYKGKPVNPIEDGGGF